MSSGQERRANPRFACDLEATVEPPDGRSIPGRTLDISSSGICVIADDAVTPGTSVAFQLRLLLGWAESDAVALRGKVVWCTKTADGHQLGARFASVMDDEHREQLGVLLKFLGGELKLPTERG